MYVYTLQIKDMLSFLQPCVWVYMPAEFIYRQNVKFYTVK